ncbi:MAG TPA: hypothetical protein VMU36_04650 [Spirochaetia bacterium]|nr:hypothetical protein [Spirochaetia bacterium]
MWKEILHAPKGQRNFGDEWGRLSITVKDNKPFRFSLSMDDHVVEYDGSRISYSRVDSRKPLKGPSVQTLRAPTIPLKNLAETFQVFCRKIDPEVRDFVLGKIKEKA